MPSSPSWRLLLLVCLGAGLVCIASVYGIVRLMTGRRAPAARGGPVPPKRVAPGGEDVRPRPPDDRPPPTPTGPRSTLPADLQDRVNQAVGAGVAYLKGLQQPTGTWPGRYPVALAALPGLTLVECGVPPTDESVRKAAKYVRDRVAAMAPGHQTYTYSLAILFLDRLGDPADRPLIRSLALRLISGQQPDGGWAYGVPKLDGATEDKLLLALTLNRPPDLAGLVKAVEKPQAMERIARGPVDRREPAAHAEAARRAVADLPAPLRAVPALADAPGRQNPRPGARTDNSNTQFATLALWASLRHGVPAETALRRVADRFRRTQRGDGRWNYWGSGPDPGPSPAMTGVGLLGLAIGHGLNPTPAGTALDDGQVKKGMEALGQLTGGPDTNHLYFLWTLERVGVLYNVRRIGGTDWYLHAVDLLLPSQHFQGGWQVGGYHEANTTVDTSLALLILRRANFAEELTKHLEGGLIKANP